MPAPRITLFEEDSNSLLSGEGSEVPIFIGKSSNPSPTTLTADNLVQYKNYNKVKKAKSAGGLYNPDDTNNPLLAAVKDFFIETAKIQIDDIGVPYIYVIDLGKEPTTELYAQALELSSKKSEIQV